VCGEWQEQQQDGTERPDQNLEQTRTNWIRNGSPSEMDLQLRLRTTGMSCRVALQPPVAITPSNSTEPFEWIQKSGVGRMSIWMIL
jgi:hypothetical protein